MILLLAALAAVVPSVVVIPDSAATEIALTAVVQLPQLGPHDRQVLDVIGRVIPRGTHDFPRPIIDEVTGGAPISCTVMPDAVILSFEVDPRRLNSGISLLNSLLRDAILDQEDLDRAAESLRRRNQDYWQAEVRPFEVSVGQVNRQEAETLYHKLFRPDRVTIGAGGPVPDTLQDNWEAKTAGWVADKSKIEDYTSETPLKKGANNVTTAAFDLPAFAANDPNLPTRLLALYALGSGKCSSLFRIAREKHAWTYRQEADLLPSVEGWSPMLFLAMAPTDEATARMVSLRQELIDDVAAWKDTDVAEALGLAEATLIRNLPYGPLLIGNAPPGESLEDRTTMATYWKVKTGQPWNPQQFLSSMSLVRLDELKETATEMLQKANIHILPGS